MAASAAIAIAGNIKKRERGEREADIGEYNGDQREINDHDGRKRDHGGKATSKTSFSRKKGIPRG